MTSSVSARLLVWLCLALCLSSCSPGKPPAPTLTVSAAASLSGAFTEIATLYKRQTGVEARLNLAASGALQKQIEAGAVVDVFASAGALQMDALEAKKLVEGRQTFARNRLVLIAPAEDKTVQGFADLAKASRVALGNPKTVPAGQYAKQCLTHLGLWDKLEPHLVPANDVRQVLDYVARGEVDAGFVYASDLKDAKVRRVAEAPDDSHDPILYPIAVLQGSSQKQAAQGFVTLVCGPEGQAILAKNGFFP